MRKLILLAGLVVIVSAAATATASATTFSGDCSWDGTLYFQTPFKFVPAYNTYHAQANGTCNGKLNGAAYNGPTVLTFDAHMNQPMSCELGIPLNLPQKITFASSPDIATAETLDMNVTTAPHVLNGELLHYTGVYNGHAYGTAVWHVQNSDIDTCAGSGLPHEDFTTTLSTITTLYG